MFTGIIQSTGTLRSIDQADGVTRLSVDSYALPLQDVAPGDSICVSGVCLTVVKCGEGLLEFDVSGESLARSTLGERMVGDPLNLEKALRAGDRFGGHYVTGHVDGVGKIESMVRANDVAEVQFGVPERLRCFIAEKGSVCVDGVSLTVNAVTASGFGVTLVPHTLAETTFDHAAAGQHVNLEVDLIARYVARLQDFETKN